MTDAPNKDAPFIKYRLIDGGTKGLLGEDLSFQTDILGYNLTLMREDGTRATLTPDGVMTALTPFRWDFGTYAVDTPAMVIASVEHDITCWLTNAGMLPWHYRAYADRMLRERLKQYSPGEGVIQKTFNFARRWWCWLGVSFNSQLIARRKVNS